MPVQGRHPSQYAWRPRRPPDTVPDLGRFAGVHATGVKPAGAGGEPGALTAHARFWEGPGVNWTRIKYCDTTRGNGWTTGKTNRILNPRDPGLLTQSRDLVLEMDGVDSSRPGQRGRSPTKPFGNEMTSTLELRPGFRPRTNCSYWDDFVDGRRLNIPHRRLHSCHWDGSSP